jgi:tetratricopeptide (TPR) repeat protein
MGIQVREKTLEEIEDKLLEMITSLNKINYLESALKESGFSFEIKRFLWEKLSEFLEEQGMYGRAANALSNKASVEVSFKERIENHLYAAELYSKVGNLDDADEMFVRALRDGNNEQRLKIKLARKNIYLSFAKSLEEKGKNVSAARFYEKIIKMNLEDIEKKEIKKKLISTYNSLGLFREARLLEGV